MTLYAGWEEVPVVEYVVTFEGAELEAVKVVSGEKLTKPTDPVKEGYTFTGWYKDEAKTTKWDFDNDTVTADVTLYAGWEADVVPGTGDLFSGWVVLLGAISLLGLTTLPRRKQN